MTKLSDKIEMYLTDAPPTEDEEIDEAVQQVRELEKRKDDPMRAQLASVLGRFRTCQFQFSGKSLDIVVGHGHAQIRQPIDPNADADEIEEAMQAGWQELLAE